jgi:hypothetical protein
MSKNDQDHGVKLPFTPLEIMPRCSAAGLDFRIIPAGFNAPLEFLTGFTKEGFTKLSIFVARVRRGRRTLGWKSLK